MARDNEGLFRNHILPVIGSKLVAEILPSDIKALWNVNTSSKSHLRQVATLTRGVFEMLVDDGVINRNPAKTRLAGKLPKPRRKVDQFYLSVDEARALLTASEGTRDYLILRCLFAFGGRPGEVLALRVDDLEPGRIRADESNSSHNGLKEPKTDEAKDYVPIPSDLEALLRAHIAGEQLEARDFLFAGETGTPMRVENYRKRNLARIAAAAGVARVDLRCMRRTVGTHLQKHASVKSTQRLLRHADVETTLENYQQPIPDEVTKAVDEWNAQLLTKK